MNKRAVILSALLSVVFCIGLTSFVFALSRSTNFNIAINPFLSLSVSSNNVSFAITPSQNGSYNSQGFTVYSSTNNSTGYTLTMTTNSVDLISNINNVTTGYPATIPTITETNDGISASAFENSTDSSILNHYGIAIGSANFNAMKAEKELKKTDANNSAQDSTTITIASKLDLNTIPGIYSTTINFSLVANPVPCVGPACIEGGDPGENSTNYQANTLGRAYEVAYVKAGKKMYIKDSQGNGYHPQGADEQVAGGTDVRFAIQDIGMTASQDANENDVNVCDTATVVDDQLQVVDLRDWKTYWIAKLANGECWMTQNLDLNLTSGVALDSATTDLNVVNTGIYAAQDGYSVSDSIIYWTPSKTTYNNDSSWDSTWEASSSFEPQSFDGGDYYFNKTDADSGNCGYGPYLDCPYYSATPFAANGHHGHIGNNYSLMATVASNGITYESSRSSYNNVPLQNSICPSGWKMPGPGDYGSVFSSYSYNGLSGPLYFVFNGTVHASSAGNLYKGFYGYYWTNMVVGSSDIAFMVEFTDSNHEINTIWANNGHSVRCLAR